MSQESKHSYLSLALLVMSFLVAILVPVTSVEAADQTGANNLLHPLPDAHYGRAVDVFSFPQDHLLHQPESIVKDTTLFVEWLYWTGALKDVETGHLYGFQYTLFHQNLMPGLIGYVQNAAISDVYNSRHPRYRYITLPNQSEITNGTDDQRGAYWRYHDSQTELTYWKNMDAWSIVTHGNSSSDGGHGKNISLNLTLVNDKMDYYLHRPSGISDQGACLVTDNSSMAGRSYYYSHPSMTTTGTLTIDGCQVNVTGESWFDHQWGGFGKCYPAWDWFSMRLDDGSFVMLYNLKDPFLNDIPDQRGLTYIDPKGNVTWWFGKDAANLTATRWWTSDLFGFRYPLEWIIDTPAGDYALEPYFDEQTMNVGKGEVKYWEGIMRVREGDHSGRQIGTGYMELTGYAPISSGVTLNTTA